MSIAVGLICVGYAASLWWMLRQEEWHIWAGLAILTVSALVLRTVYLHQYPRGYYPDELESAYSAVGLAQGSVWRALTSDVKGPFIRLWPVLSEGIPYRWGLSQFWAVRGGSMILGSLCVPLAFATARAAGCRAASACVAAVGAMALPYALLYGRVSEGGDYLFHEWLVLWTTLSLLTHRERFGAVLIGIGAFTLLLCMYPVVRVYLHLTLGVALFASWFQPGPPTARWYLLLMVAVALALFLPAILSPETTTLTGLWPSRDWTIFNETWFAEAGWPAIWHKVVAGAQTLVRPTADPGTALSVAAASVHPPWVLAVAGVGVLAGPWWRTRFLLVALPASFVPMVINHQMNVSSHELLPVYPLVTLAMACGMDRLPLGAMRGIATAVFCGVLVASSVTFFFSPQFWSPETERAFGWCHGAGVGSSADTCLWQ